MTAWEMPGSRLGAVWEAPGRLSGKLFGKLSGDCLGTAWEVCGELSEAIWKRSGERSVELKTWELSGDLSGSPPEAVRDLSEKLSGKLSVELFEFQSGIT